MQGERTRLMATVSLLAAMSFLLMFAEVPLPGFPDFLKFDPSDVAALVAGFSLGPAPGVLVVVLRNLLRTLVKADLIGLTMNTVAGASFVGVASLYYQRRLNRSAAMIALALGGGAQVLVCCLSNLVALPLYGVPQASVVPMIWMVILPFNGVKCVLNGVLTFHLYKRLARHLPRYRDGVFRSPGA